MDIIEALKVLCIDDIMELDEVELKKKFRKLIKDNHPDRGGNADLAIKINEAHALIKKALKELQAYKQLTTKQEFICIIPISKLSKIYLGEELELSSNGHKDKLTRYNMRSNKVILLTNVEILYKGNTFNFDHMCVTNIRDEYSIDCKITDSDVFSTESLTIKAYDKTVKANITGTKLNLILSFDKLVKLTVHVERSERSG